MKFKSVLLSSGIYFLFNIHYNVLTHSELPSYFQLVQLLLSCVLQGSLQI